MRRRKFLEACRPPLPEDSSGKEISLKYIRDRPLANTNSMC